MAIDRRNHAPTNLPAGHSKAGQPLEAWTDGAVRLLQAAGIFPIVRTGRHIGQAGSPEQVIALLARWKPRGFLPDHLRKRCDAIPKGRGLLETTGHDIGPIIRLTAARATGRMIPRLDLTLDQPLERLRDLPFLIALDAGSQRAGFSNCFQPDLDQPSNIEKL
jgi:hypothetical protein